jgi:hypothetical protein
MHGVILVSIGEGEMRLAIGLVCLALVRPTLADDSLKVGDTLRLYASEDGAIPAVESEAAYRTFLAGVRSNADPRLYLDSVTVPGRLVEVLELKDDRSYPLRAPVAKVMVAEGLRKGDIIWVAQQYLRPRGTPAPRGEFRLPDFISVPDPNYVVKRGDICNLHAHDRVKIPLGLTLDAFRRITAALAAESGKDSPVEGPEIIHGSNNDQLEVVRRHPFRAVECRLLDGPHAGEFVWVPERFVVQYDVRVSWPRAKGGRKSRTASRH